MIGMRYINHYQIAVSGSRCDSRFAMASGALQQLRIGSVPEFFHRSLQRNNGVLMFVITQHRNDLMDKKNARIALVAAAASCGRLGLTCAGPGVVDK
ncbi:hypothetical protein HCH_06883 [Hahella chejuensis KCTC 2396]|uniref:Uncharacterized protein n=1 Tax=Hahella chejuensis (strain KCTC 2396) TaxID=349521 RepID=Q2S773_HAHCH|nr:hypothetical protein HCH_06883 [Hahella chejuensis KCTC 2396]